MSTYAKYSYVNNITIRNKLMRLLWTFSSAIFFAWTPRVGFNLWRIFILRIYGAKIGKGCKISATAKIWAPWKLTMGDFVCIADDVDCYSVDNIRIGNKVTISQRSFLCTASHNIKSLTRPMESKPIIIGNHAWVCAEAYIGPGVKLGDGSVIAARAVVSKDVEQWKVMAGNPAECIKAREIK